MKNYSFEQLSEKELLHLESDAKYRIRSHISGGNVIEGYIQSQRDLLKLISRELKSRSEHHDTENQTS